MSWEKTSKLASDILLHLLATNMFLLEFIKYILPF